MSPLVEQLPISKYAFKCQTLWGIAGLPSILGGEFLLIASLIFFVHPEHSADISTKGSETVHHPLYFETIFWTLTSLIFTMVFFCMVIFIWTVFYLAFFWGNMYFAWGRDTAASLRGPTHISLSPLSLKLIWKGAVFKNIGFMFGWDDISTVDLYCPDKPETGENAGLIISVKKGKMVHNLTISLAGFKSYEERLIFRYCR